MNDLAGTPRPHGDAIEIVSSPALPAGEHSVDHASLRREAFRDLDRAIPAAIARITGGLSPIALLLAYSDWAMHLGAAPGKQLELALDLWRDWVQLSQDAARATAERKSPT